MLQTSVETHLCRLELFTFDGSKKCCLPKTNPQQRSHYHYPLNVIGNKCDTHTLTLSTSFLAFPDRATSSLAKVTNLTGNSLLRSI